MPDLGARLLRAGLVTREQLAWALARGPAGGGPLAAVLVEAGVSEETLVGFFLADGHGPLVGRTELRAADAVLVASIEGAMARDLFVLPVARRDEGVLVAMADPTDTDALAELHRVLGARPVPIVARVSDLRAVLAHHYPLPSPTALSEPSLALVGSRMSIEEADEPVPLVRTKAVPHTPTPSSPPVRAAKPTVRARRSVPARRDPRTRSYAPPPPAPNRPRSSAPPGDDRWGDLSEPPPPATPSPPIAQSEPSAPPPRRAATPAPPPHEPTLGDVGGLLAALRTCKQRDEAVKISCEAALSVGRSVVFLARRRAVLEGRRGIGPGLSEEAVRHLWIPVGAASVFDGPLARGEAYLGPWGTTAADALLRAATASRGGRLLVQPVHLGDRVAGVLCVDEPRRDPHVLARMEVLAHALGQAFQRLIVESRR